MATYSTIIPGLPGGPLKTSFPIHVSLIPASNTYLRPGLKLRGTFETTQHATANWNSLAADEAAYFLKGAEGRQASVHLTIDDTESWALIPVDEVAWHATDGSGPGNMTTVALELTQKRSMVNDPVRWRRARSNAAELLAKIAARKKADRKGKRHRDWYPVKDCPAVLNDNPTWSREYDEDYAKFFALEAAEMAGTAVGGGIEDMDPIIRIGDTIAATVNLNLRQSANTSAPIVATLKPGDTAVVTGAFESAQGYGWLPVRAGVGNGYVAMGGSDGAYLEKVANGTPTTPEPTYAKVSPIPALLDTDLQKYDTANGITSDDNGNEFVFVADVIEFTQETVAGQYAGDPQSPVKAPYQAGDRAIAAWLVKTDTGWFYVLAGEGDEWVRVRYDHTKRISDAPLLPEAEKAQAA